MPWLAMREGDERTRSDLVRAGGAAAFTLVSEEEMLATSDFTLKRAPPRFFSTQPLFGVRLPVTLIALLPPLLLSVLIGHFGRPQ
jgi:hypothetical protein